jgi:hypothetical protein
MAYKNYVNEIWVKQVAQALAKKFNVKVRKGSSWSADVTKGVLTYGPEIFLLTHNQALGLLTHEIAHLRHTREPSKHALTEHYPKLDHEGVNCIEDRRIERVMGDTFPGAKEAIGMMNERILDELRTSQAIISQKEMNSFEKVNDALEEKNLTPYVNTDTYIRDRVDTDTLPPEKAQAFNWTQEHGLPSTLTQILLEASAQYHGREPNTAYWSKEIVDTATKIAEKWKTDKIEELSSTQAVADYWRSEIYPMLSAYFSETEEKKQNNSGYSAGDEHGKPDEKDYYAPSMSQRIRKEVNKMHEQEHGMSAGLNEDGRRGGMNYISDKASVQDLTHRYGRLLKQVLKDNMWDRWGGHHLSGKLNARKLYKHRMGKMNLFQRIQRSDKRDFSFTVICDTSGSMQGTRYSVARKSMVLLNEVLEYCGIPNGVYSFAWSVNEARRVGDRIDYSKFANAFQGSGGGTDVVKAYQLSVPPLKELGRKNKIHICITDGCFRDEWSEYIKETMQKNKDIVFYGIGIQADLAHVYPEGQFFEVQQIEELMPTLMGILRRHIVG